MSLRDGTSRALATSMAMAMPTSCGGTAVPGEVYIWLMNGATITSTGTPGSPTSDWSIAGVGDFDGNGTSDILWKNSTTGQVYIWFMNGTTYSSSASVSYVSLRTGAIEGVGDYDGSGRAGILWRNSSNGPGLHLADER